MLQEQLKKEIAHIFESGANEVRIYNLITSYLENNRVDSLKIKKAVNILEKHNELAVELTENVDAFEYHHSIKFKLLE